MTRITDVEQGSPPRQSIAYMRQVVDQAGITQDVEQWKYEGSGTEPDPFVVTWIDKDPRNPMLYSPTTKWLIVVLSGSTCLAFTLVSSIYTGAAEDMIRHFKCSQEVWTLGLSLYVLGFATGSLLWAPLSEMYGRQIVFATSFGAFTALNGGTIPINSTAGLIVLRFFAGAMGSAPVTNVGGLIADMFAAEQRSQALAIFSAAPLLGPILGPIFGGFISENVGWRWVFSFSTILSGVLWLLASVFVPETYAPVLLRHRAAQLSRRTGHVYMIRSDIEQGKKTVGELLKINLTRPWILLFREPIVLLLSLYTAIVYGILYMLFGAFPIVFQQKRGWSPGIGGLSFIGIMVGCLAGVGYCLWENNRYLRIAKTYKGFAPPEVRLAGAMVASVAMPISLFWFAWTNGPSVHWSVPIIASAPFGFGLLLIFLSIFNYLIDSYTIYAASVLAANGLLRSFFGASFPLFTRQMYANLGIHWAASLTAFLALACAPMPFYFYKYGPGIRARCKYAAEAAAFLARLQQSQTQAADKSSSSTTSLDDIKEKPDSDPFEEKYSLARQRTRDTLTAIPADRLFDTGQDHSLEEVASFEKIVKYRENIGQHLKVSQAAPRTDNGVFFNNLDFIGVDWQLESVTIGITGSGRVGFVETAYDNGVILRKGLSTGNLTRKTLQGFRPGERITSVAIESGTTMPVGDLPMPTGPWVLSVCLFTSRGRRLAGRGADNEVLIGRMVRKGNTIYDNVTTLYCDTPYSMGSLKGFFGRVDNDPVVGGILRLGVIWGDSSSDADHHLTIQAPISDVDGRSMSSTLKNFLGQRDQARVEAANAQRELVSLKRMSADRKQVKLARGLNMTRQSVSFKPETFETAPSSEPFLTFDNGVQFKYDLRGNLIVQRGEGNVLWSIACPYDTPGNLAFSDSNILDWDDGESGVGVNGTLIFSSEAPFIEILNANGQRRWCCPEMD